MKGSPVGLSTVGRGIAAAVVLGLCLTGAAIVSPEPGALDPASAQGAKPNILIIVTDDQRSGMSVMPRTLRFFGDGGTAFTRGFTNTPLCCPARATLMSGRYPHNHRVVGNSSWANLDQTKTLQADLQANGYRTAIFGKYLNNFPVSVMDPVAFDRWAVFQSGDGSPYYRNGIWNDNGDVRTISKYTTHVIRSRAVRFVRQNTEQPWMMFVTVPAPHAPFEAERKYRDLKVGRWNGNPAVLEKDRSDKPPWIRRFDKGLDYGRKVRAGQYRTLPSVDDLVGELRSALVDTRQARRTLAFFTTDNSYLWGEHGLGGKPSPYMQSINVPFYVRWPAALEPGQVDHRLVGHVDITATAYDAADVQPGHMIDGRSLLTDFSRDRLLTEMLAVAKGIPKWASLLTADGDHYIEYYDGDGLLFQELYEHEFDPWELRNVAGDRPSDTAQLSALLAVDRDCRGNACP